MKRFNVNAALERAILDLDKEIRIPIFMAHAYEKAQDWFDKPAILVAEFEKEPIKSHLNSKNMKPEQLAKRIYDGLHSNFPRALGQQFYQILPSGFDKHARKVVNDLKFDEGVSYQAFVNEAVSKVKEDLFSSTLSKRLLRINKDDVMMAMLFFALALPLSLILAGSWKIILSR